MLHSGLIKHCPVRIDRHILSETPIKNKTNTLRPLKETVIFKKINLKEIIQNIIQLVSILIFITHRGAPTEA